jgi:HK97 family phage portal protein
MQTAFQPVNALPFPVFATGTRDYIQTVDGRTISFAYIFATQPWVAAAVMRMLTWSVRVPLKVYRHVGDDDRVRLRAKDHPLAAAIEQPWEGGYPAALTMALLGSLLVHGNTVTEVLEGRSGKIEFGPQDWRYLSPVQPSRDEISGWTVAADIGQRSRTFSADEAVHVKWWSPLGPEGVSALQQLGTTISIEDAAQRYMRIALKNGARPPSAIQASTEFLGLEPEVRKALLDQLREDVTALYAGPENSGRPALLPPGLEWNAVGHSAQEAELINTRYVDREEVAAVYQIPPPMLGDLRRATFSNITELRQVAYTDGLGPPLVLIEQVITSHILRTLLREDDTYVEFDFAAVLRGDFLKEINALRGAISMGLLTPHEGRSVINRPRTDEPDADKLWMPFNNLQPIGTVPVKFQKTPVPAPGDQPQQQPGKQPPPGKQQPPPPQKAPSGFVIVEDWRAHVKREQEAAAVEVPAALEEPTPDPEGALS